jgi:hypothetical protein
MIVLACAHVVRRVGRLPVRLQHTAATLLGPLHARAADARRLLPLLGDAHACALVERLDPVGLFAPDIPRLIERWNIGLAHVETTRFLGSTPRRPGPLVLSAARAIDTRRPYVIVQFRASSEATSQSTASDTAT